MEIVISKEQIKEAVAGLSKVISAKTTMPVLSHVKFFTYDNVLKVSGTDLEQSATFSFSNVTINKPGAFLFPFETLKSLAKTNGKEEISFKQTSPTTVQVINAISGQLLQQNVETIEVSEFPSAMPQVDETFEVENSFIQNFHKAATFVSEDESRRILNCVYLDVTEQNHHVVGCDGRRLGVFNSVTLPIKTSIAIRPSKFMLWARLVDAVSFMIGADSTMFKLSTPRWEYNAKIEEGTYPNFRQVIPAKNDKHVFAFAEADISMLRQVFTTLAGHDRNNKPITVIGLEGKVSIYGQDNNTSSWSKVELANSQYYGKSTLFTVNRDYLMDALQIGFKVFQMENNTCPLLAMDAELGMHVLMPLSSDVIPDGIVVEDFVPTQINAQEETTTAAVQPEPEAVNKKERKTMPETKTETISTLEKVLLAYELARGKIKEAQSALSDIAAAIKDVARDEKSRKNELVTARETLARLQAIRI